MSEITHAIQMYRFNRDRTLGLFNKMAEEQGDRLQQSLGWRPAPGRANIGWQLLHIGITEEIFACQRLAEQTGRWPELWADFRGGSTPRDEAPEANLIRDVLAGSREELVQSLGQLEGSDLSTIPEGWKNAGFTLRQILALVGWHESHHQGQAHITYNMYRAAVA